MSELFHSLLTEVRFLCYQPEYRKCFHSAKIFKFVVAEILFLLYEIMVSVGARLQPFAGFCKVFYLLIDTLQRIICVYIYIYICVCVCVCVCVW